MTIKSYNRFLSILKNLPVAVNGQLGDPLQKTQWIDTLKKIKKLEESGHCGPVALFTKSIINESQMSIVKKTSLDIWLFMSITGLNENKKYQFKTLEENYLYACSTGKHVVINIQPVISKQNDRLKVIEPILNLSKLGQKIIVMRGFINVINGNMSHYEGEEFFALIDKWCNKNSLSLYKETACAVAARLQRLCSSRANQLPEHIDLIRYLGYPLQLSDNELLLDGNYKQESFDWTRGDNNFIRMICLRDPVIPKPKNSSLLSISAQGIPLHCTSSWFTWARQTKCEINCWYCSAASNSMTNKLIDIGCNPIDLILR